MNTLERILDVGEAAVEVQLGLAIDFFALAKSTHVQRVSGDAVLRHFLAERGVGAFVHTKTVNAQHRQAGLGAILRNPRQQWRIYRRSGRLMNLLGALVRNSC